MMHTRIPDFSEPVPLRAIVVPSTIRRQLPVDRRSPALSFEPRQSVELVRPDPAPGRSRRFLDASAALLATVVIIGGGMVLTGLATLL